METGSPDCEKGGDLNRRQTEFGGHRSQFFALRNTTGAGSGRRVTHTHTWDISEIGAHFLLDDPERRGGPRSALRHRAEDVLAIDLAEFGDAAAAAGWSRPSREQLGSSDVGRGAADQEPVATNSAQEREQAAGKIRALGRVVIVCVSYLSM